MKKLLMTMLVAVFVLQAGFAMAVSTIHIGDSSGGYLWNNELVSVGGSDVGMQVASGNDMGYGYGDPVYLLLGIAGATSTPLTIHDTTTSGAGTVLQGGGALSYSFDALWGNPYNNTAMDAYQVLGLGSQNSQNWTNWTGSYTDLTGLTTPDFFGLFAYDLTSAGFDGSAMEIDFNDDLAVGTFVFGYAVFPGKTNGDNIFNTPITETGFVLPPPSVPEPSTLLLLGSGLLGLAVMRRRKS